MESNCHNCGHSKDNHLNGLGFCYEGACPCDGWEDPAPVSVRAAPMCASCGHTKTAHMHLAGSSCLLECLACGCKCEKYVAKNAAKEEIAVAPNFFKIKPLPSCSLPEDEICGAVRFKHRVDNQFLKLCGGVRPSACLYSGVYNKTQERAACQGDIQGGRPHSQRAEVADSKENWSFCVTCSKKNNPLCGPNSETKGCVGYQSMIDAEEIESLKAQVVEQKEKADYWTTQSHDWEKQYSKALEELALERGRADIYWKEIDKAYELVEKLKKNSVIQISTKIDTKPFQRLVDKWRAEANTGMQYAKEAKARGDMFSHNTFVQNASSREVLSWELMDAIEDLNSPVIHLSPTQGGARGPSGPCTCNCNQRYPKGNPRQNESGPHHRHPSVRPDGYQACPLYKKGK